jgi:hypothetical protein
MHDALSGIITIASAIIGVAILAVLVSNRAQTSQVLGAAGNAFGYDLAMAVSPVTGQTPSAPMSYAG